MEERTKHTMKMEGKAAINSKSDMPPFILKHRTAKFGDKKSFPDFFCLKPSPCKTSAYQCKAGQKTLGAKYPSF